jgi:hypothetical protein
MLMSTAARITPAPYAGINRVRFNGFAGVIDDSMSHVSGLKDHPKVTAV